MGRTNCCGDNTINRHRRTGGERSNMADTGQKQITAWGPEFHDEGMTNLFYVFIWWGRTSWWGKKIENLLESWNLGTSRQNSKIKNQYKENKTCNHVKTDDDYIFYQSIIYFWVEMIVWGKRKGMNQKQYTTTTTVNHLYLPLSFSFLPSSLSFSLLILVSAIINIFYYLHK